MSSITDYQKRKPVGTCITNVPIDIVHRSRLTGQNQMQLKEVVQIAQRKDGRPRSSEPFGASAERLEDLDYGCFRLWCNQPRQS